VDHPGESPTCAVPIMSLVVTEYTLIRSSSLCMYSWASFAFKHCQVGAGLNQCRRSVLKLSIYIIYPHDCLHIAGASGRLQTFPQ
jgi:hypothetical protein